MLITATLTLLALTAGGLCFIELQSVLNLPASGLPVANATRSFWLDGDGANPLADAGSAGELTGEADVCVVGSGITGVSAAFHLSNQPSPPSIVILEAREFCSGATGRNGGHLIPTLFSAFRSRLSKHGLSNTLRSYLVEQYTTASILAFVNKHNLSETIDLVDGGHIGLLLTPTEEQDARSDWDAAIHAGWESAQNTTWLNANEMNEKYGTPYPSYQTQGYNLWPLKLVTQLYSHAARSPSLNLTLHTHTPVQSITPTSPLPSSRRWTLNTPRGPVHCSSVLHATNAYASHLVPSLSSSIIPTRGQVLSIDISTPDTSPASPAIPSAGAWGANLGYEYWFPRPRSQSADDVTSTTVILGGGRESSGTLETNEVDDGTINPRVGETLRTFLPRIFSGIQMNTKIIMEWTGIMGFTKTGDPLVGPLHGLQGQFISAGYTGHGMTRAFACAEAVAGMIAAELGNRAWEMPAWFPEHYLTERERIQ
ncbi:hypothetical protein AX17_001598 [Amanita inopinata Kibby_2008]|nr:hypothetical protein AX17_001598 [Amanita inopinata Kibby_2008]